MISTLLNRISTNPRRVEFQLPQRTIGVDVHPTGGLVPTLCLFGTRQNRVLRDPERDGGRRLVEPNGPHYRTLPPALQHPVVEALAPRGASYPRLRYPPAMAAQIGVDLLLGVLACVQILGLLATGRTRDASMIMMTHGNQLNLLAGTGLTVGMMVAICVGLGIP